MIKRIFGAALTLCFLLTALPFQAFAISNGTAYYDGAVAQQTYDTKKYCNAAIEDNFTENEILIVLNKQASESFRKYTPADFSQINCVEVKDLTAGYEAKIAQQRNSTERNSIKINNATFRRILCLTLSDNSKQNVLTAIKELEKRADVISAEPNYIQSFQTPQVSRDAGGATIVENLDPTWGLAKIGLSTSVRQAFPGSSSIKVGIIGTGIDASHPTLDGRVSVAFSRDFAQTHETDLESAQAALTDIRGHETQVAGIIGAEFCSLTNPGNNDVVYFQGICSDITLVSLKVSISNSTSYDISCVIAAITYAAEIDIAVINYSDSSLSNSASLKQAITDFGGVFVCSIGNWCSDIDEAPRFPCCFSVESDNLIAVGASDKSDGRFYLNHGVYDGSPGDPGSNFGEKSVDLFAPGVNILTTYPVQMCDADCNNEKHFCENYHLFGFTSGATPFVAGVAALIMSVNPTLSPEHVKEIILDNVDSVSALNGLCVTGGRLNAASALQAVASHTMVHSDANTLVCTAPNCSCTEEFENDHNVTFTNVGTQHSICCQTCNTTILQNHTLAYTSNGSTSHTESCAICNYTSQKSHSITYTPNNVHTHEKDCSLCDYCINERHQWKAIGDKYRCTSCGMVSAIIPMGRANIPNALLQKLQAATTKQSGECFIYLEEGVFLYKDGQYYMLVEYVE